MTEPEFRPDLRRCEHTVDGLMAAMVLLKADIRRLEERNAELADELARARSAAIRPSAWATRRPG